MEDNTRGNTHTMYGRRAMPKPLFLVLIGLFLLAVIPAAALAVDLNHNTSNPALSGSTKWGGAGWGVATKQYGPITCTTCHEPRATNIKAIKSSITAQTGSFPGQAQTVVFDRLTSSVVNINGTFGDDNDPTGRATSNRICEVCHSQTKFHNFNTANNTGGLTHQNRKDCTTCHKHGNGFKNAGGACNSCHGEPPSDATLGTTTGLVGTVTGGTNPSSPGAHVKHNSVNIVCDACHNGNGMASNIYDSKITINFSGVSTFGNFSGKPLINGFSWIGGGSTNIYQNAAIANPSCSTLYCHSNGGNYAGTKAYRTVNWTGSALACDKCHGNGTGTLVLTDRHPKHLTYSYTCQECHAATVDGANAIIGNHVNGAKDVAWKASGMNNGGDAYVHLTGCGNIYCHSQGTNTGSQPWPAPNVAAAWNAINTAYSTCSACHGGAVGAAYVISSNQHGAHVNNASYPSFRCGECHAKTVSTGSDILITNSSNHVNKFKDYSGAKAYKTGFSGGNCTSYCHSGGKTGAPAATTVNWATGPAIDCKGCHGVTGSYAGEPTYANGAAPLVNNHNKHVAGAADCVKCHFKTTQNGTAIVAGSTLHIDKVMNVNFKLLPFANNSGVYNNATRTCSTTYCHGGSTPTWGGVPLTCNQCHEASNLLPQGHTIHWASTANASKFSNMSGNVSTAAAYRFSCASCHGTDATQHATGAIASQSAAGIFFSFSSAGRGAAANTAYNTARPLTGVLDTKNYYYTTGGAGACNVTYCHSNGRGGNGINTFYNWTSNVGSLGCGGCHGVATTTGGNALSGRHDKHVNNTAYLGSNMKCADCHEKTLSAGTDTTLSNRAKHVNKFRDYSGAKAYRTNYSAPNCTVSWCHSNGKQGTIAVSNVSVNWTATAVARFRCNSCHGTNTGGTSFVSQYGEPNYGSGAAGAADANNHLTHVKVKQITCDKCHSNTMKASTTGPVFNSYTSLKAGNATHLDKLVNNVTFQGFSSAWRATTNYTAGSKTCNNIACHSNGKGTYQTGLVWGATTLSCSGCHPTLSGAHGKHIGNLLSAGTVTFYNYTAVKSLGDEATPLAGDGYKFGCASCHPLALGSHLNGYIEVELNTTAGAGSIRTKTTAATVNGTVGSGTVTCTAVYCHGDGKNAPAGTTIAWNQTFTGDRCAKCHGNSPTTGAHQVHVVGIHYDNIYKGNGLAGKLAAGTGGAGGNSQASSHGSTGSVQDTVINCDICHYSTVRVKYNDKNAVCTTCHNGGPTGTLRGDAKLYSLANHVNGKVEFAFTAVANDATVRSKAQLRQASFTVYTAAGAFWNRNGTYKSGGTAYDSAKTALSTPMFSAGNCSNIVCHNGRKVNWTNDVGKAAECVICHRTL